MKSLVRLGLAWALCVAPAAGTEPLSSEAIAQEGPVNETPSLPEGTSLYDAASPFQLFDPSRLSMRHSYSMSFFNAGGQTHSVGMYMNSIGYQLARPLYIQFDVGIMHQPGALFGDRNASSGARVLPNFSLRYTPSPKFHLIVDVRTVPGAGGYYYGAPMYGPWH